MAEFNFDTTPEAKDTTAETAQAPLEPAAEAPANSAVHDNGMSMQEINDANKIQVTVADYNTPLVILFGPPTCGKTMTLIRLTRYLKSNGFTVQPITSFRPSYDKNYADMCNNFDAMINSDDAAASTAKINFMLVQVMRNGRPLCQILEGPGEYYFDPEAPNASFPRYVHAIIRSRNRKLWAIMVEPDNTNRRMNVTARKNYVSKIHSLKSNLSPRDKVMFVFNKIDETPFVISPGNIRYSQLKKHTEYLYPNIFEAFRNVNPITRLWRPYDFSLVAFQTGNFSKTADGELAFEEGHDIYPQKLWSFIRKQIG